MMTYFTSLPRQSITKQASERVDATVCWFSRNLDSVSLKLILSDLLLELRVNLFLKIVLRYPVL